MQLQGVEQATRAIEANTSPRYKRLENLGSWATGTQYIGRPDWFTGGKAEVPLWERQPCIVYPVVDVAIRSNVDLVFGQGRFPELTTKPGEDEPDEENGLGEDASQAVDRFLREYHKLSRFKAHCRDAFADAQSCGTAIGIHGHRDGIPFNELIPAKWGTPKLGIHGETLSLEIRYPYLEEYRDPTDGKWKVRARLYRRVIDKDNDTTFLPADAREDGVEPKWQVDPLRTIPHNLGFCPVVWYAFMRGCAPVNKIDGNAIHALLLDEIQGHDIALSQKHRCSLLAEPQPWISGVTQDYNPSSVGRVAVIQATERGGDPRYGDNTGAATGNYVIYDGDGSAIKKGPGFLWRLPKGSEAGYLSFPDGLLKSMDEHCLDVLAKIEDALCVVLPKPASFKFAAAVSGRALEQVRERQYNRCDQYREDLTDHFLLPSVRMQLRIAERVGDALKVPGIAKVLPLLRGEKAPDSGSRPAEPQSDAA